MSGKCIVSLTLKQVVHIMTTMLRIGARDRIAGLGTMLETGMSRVRFPLWFLPSIHPLTQTNTRNLPGRSTVWSARKADNLTCKSIIYKMWEPRLLTTLWASPACYRDIFVHLPFLPYSEWITIRNFLWTENMFG
jgi:hypothetical protein